MRKIFFLAGLLALAPLAACDDQDIVVPPQGDNELTIVDEPCGPEYNKVCK